MQELGLLFEEKMEELYSEELKNDEDNDAGDESDEEELSIEDQVKNELTKLKESNKTVITYSNGEAKRKKEPLQFIELNCECVIFCKTRKPIIPEKFVSKIIEDLADPNNMMKRTRYIQKLTPITYSCNATMEQFILLLKRVLAPHFHEGENANKKIKFAVNTTRRNFNTIERMDIITHVVKQVIQDDKYQHEVDLKNFDKMILVECFKNNMGVAVVDGSYATRYKKFNVQQIFEAKFKNEAEKNDEKKD